MTDIGAFPTLHDILISGDNIYSMTAGETIVAGQVVGIAASGASNTVVCMDNTSGEHALGVALHGASSTGKVAVAGVGCVCTCVNADDTTTIEAGDWVMQNANAVLGTVSAFSVRAALGSTTTDLNDTHLDVTYRMVGLATTAFTATSAGGTGEVLLFPYLCLVTDHAVV